MNSQQIPLSSKELGNPMSILVVDDTPDNIRLLSTILTDQGYEVRKALNGKMALMAVNNSLPDLILLDINMPDIDGYQVCEQLKQNPRTQDIPVIFISALDEVTDKIKAFKLGAVDYVTKPFEQGEVISRVHNQLRLRSLQLELEKKNNSLEQAMQQLQQAQAGLVQQQKMLALGQLVAGIAHEINNPVTFIYSNLSHIRNYTSDLMRLLVLYRTSTPANAEITNLEEEIDIEFLNHDLSKLMKSMQAGAERIREIVFSLRNFSRLGEAERKLADIHAGLDSTLMLLEYRLKGSMERSEVEIVRDYGELPLVECYAGKMNQVWMNILNNAIDSLESRVANDSLESRLANDSLESRYEKNSSESRYGNKTNASSPDNQDSPFPQSDSESSIPQIIIRTSLTESGQVGISIQDNGCGMTGEVRERVFEPFFSTKGVRQSGGLGMTISYGIIINEHQGDISCTSEPGVGTTIHILLPQTV
jgi:signal transduction histidine kinase